MTRYPMIGQERADYTLRALKRIADGDTDLAESRALAQLLLDDDRMEPILDEERLVRYMEQDRQLLGECIAWGDTETEEKVRRRVEAGRPWYELAREIGYEEALKRIETPEKKS